MSAKQRNGEENYMLPPGNPNQRRCKWRESQNNFHSLQTESVTQLGRTSYGRREVPTEDHDFNGGK